MEPQLPLMYLYWHNGMIDPLEVRKSIIEIIGRYFADDH